MTDEKRKLIEPEFNRAIALRESNPQEAIRILKELDRRFPNTSTIVGMLAGIFHLIKDWANALPWYEKSIVLSPRSELTSLGLFHTLCHHDRFDDAMTEAKRFIALNGLTEGYSELLTGLDDEGAFDLNGFSNLTNGS